MATSAVSAAPTAATNAMPKHTLTKNQKKKLKKKLKKAAALLQAEDTLPNNTEHAQKPEGEESVVTNHQDAERVAKGS